MDRQISYQCDQCGRWYTAKARSAGKTVKCTDCGAAMKVPRAPDQSVSDMDVYGLPDRDQGAANLPRDRGQKFQGASSKSAKARPFAFSKTNEPTSSFNGFFRGGLGTIGILVLLAFRFYFRWERNQARQARPNNHAVVVAPVEAGIAAPSQNAAPWKMPALPPPPAGTQIEPGVLFSEITLGTSQPAGESQQPGHVGKLWLYLPVGEHAPKSLPCILIAAAGSNLITGMDLGDGDRPEHLPYAHAGFAVVAYELDGGMPENAKGNLQALIRSSQRFLNAEAGLVNARVAIEYATTQVAAVDPRRLYAVGHSSAATEALLVAENEPRIAACVAFAPAVDLAVQYEPPAQKELAQLIPGAGEFFTRFNPRAKEAKVDCPLFLFYADDDAGAASGARDLGTRLRHLGKKVTISNVASGGHYQSMIKVGVPRAIRWLQSLAKPTR